MTVTKIEKSLDRKYGPIVLWWDDVTQIFNSLSENCRSVELATTDYKFATLDAAKGHLGDGPQYDIRIIGSAPYSVVEDGRLHVSSGPNSAKIFLEIGELLSRRQRRPKWIYSSRLGVIVIILGPFIYLVADEYIKFGLLVVQCILTIIYVRGIAVSMKRGFVVHMQRKSEARTFLQRNKDQLLMYFITGVLGAVVGFGLSQVKDRYFPPSVQTK